jgi:hypothetical protein
MKTVCQKEMEYGNHWFQRTSGLGFMRFHYKMHNAQCAKVAYLAPHPFFLQKKSASFSDVHILRKTKNTVKYFERNRLWSRKKPLFQQCPENNFKRNMMFGRVVTISYK